MKKDQGKVDTENGVDDASGSELVEQTDLSPELLEAIDALPSKYRETVAKAIRVSHFSGPLPPPKMLGEYEEVLPGSADRIIKLAEDNAQHRRFWEAEILNASSSDNKQKNWFRFLLPLVAIGGAIFLAYRGLSPFSYVLIIYALAGFVSRLLDRFLASTRDD